MEIQSATVMPDGTFFRRQNSNTIHDGPVVLTDQPRTPAALSETGPKKAASYVALWLAALICLLWPAFYNGQYLVFFDTLGYLAGPAHALYALLGIETEWSQSFGIGLQSAIADTNAELSASQAAHNDGFVSAGRSIYYGILIFAGALVGSLWVSIAVQAALALWAISLAVKQFFPGQLWLAPIFAIALAALTPLPFFTSYVMPDFAAGLTIIAAAGLLTARAGQGTGLMWQWLFILMGSVAFHTSHLANAVILLVAGSLLVFAVRRKFPVLGATGVLAAVLLGIGLQMVFDKMVEIKFGAEPVMPPFLMARVISDGPGYEYLVEECPTTDLTVCQFLPVLPLGSDEFLWSKTEGAAVVGVASREVVRALSDEQMRFVLGVLKTRFLDQFAVSFSGFSEQFTRIGLSEFAYTTYMHEDFVQKAPDDVLAGFESSRLFTKAFPLERWSAAIYASALLSLVLVLAFWVRSFGTRAHGDEMSQRDLLLFCGVVTGGVVANAAITGVLSTPHDRYQSRVVWLITLLALMAVVSWWNGRKKYGDLAG